MADKVVSLEFNVKTAGAVTEINKVTKATEDATAATINYEKQLDDIKKATDGGGFKDLSRALKEYQDIALKAGESSPIGRQALAEAGELKDRLLDLKGAIKTTGQDGLALQGSLQLGGGIVAGFGAVQGVMALVGSESEDLQKTLVKLQAVQATLASVEEIRAVLEKESALRIMAVTVAEKARAAATAVSTFVTNASTVSLKLFRTALIATGIGAIVYVLYEAANAMGVFGNATDEATEKLEKQKKIRADLDSQIEDSLKTDIDIRKSRKNGVEDIKNDIEILKAKGATTKDIYLAEKKLIDEQLANLAYAKGFRGSLTNQELIEQKKLNNEKIILEIKYNKDIKDAEDKATEESKRIAAEKLQQERADAKEAIKIADEQYLELQRIKNTAKEQEILELTLEYEKKYELAKGNAELENALLEEQNLKAVEIGDKYRAIDEENWQNEIKLLEEAVLYDLELEDRKKAREKQNIEDKKKQREEELAEEIRIRDAKVQIANDLQSTLTNLGNLIINDSAKAVKFNKAMALIQIGIDTATALSKALSVTQSPSPDNVATGGLAGVAKYAGIAAMIFANAAKAKQILASGNAAGQAPTLGGGGGNAPIQSMQTTAPKTPGRVSNITGSQTTTVKAIVVESDITTTQKRINSIQEIAKI